MLNLLTAIYGKFAGSALSTYVGGRIYVDRAPANTKLPYVVYFIVSGTPDWTFKERLTDTLIQFSLFSSSKNLTEVTTMYADLKTLFDECTLTITSNTFLYMQETNLTTMVEDITVSGGLNEVKHWAVDYTVKTQVS
jgi:hypothetical protein